MRRRLRTVLGTAWAGLMVYGIFLIVVRRLAGVPKLPDEIGVPVLILCFFPGWLAYRWIERLPGRPALLPRGDARKFWSPADRAACVRFISFLVGGLVVVGMLGLIFGVGPLADLFK